MAAHTSRNRTVGKGCSKHSRSVVYKKRALYKRKKTGVSKAVAEVTGTKVKTIGGDKNGEQRTVPVQRATRFYPTEDVKKPLKTRKQPKTAKLRSSITPGTVLILLAGRHKGKRVVFLRQLESGLLLVTGPYKINGVPLRRVPQSYVIATKTKVNISDLTVPAAVSEAMFTRENKKRKPQLGIFEESDLLYKVSDERKEAQQEVDNQILPKISEVDHLRKYMSSVFTLRKGQYPHAMLF